MFLYSWWIIVIAVFSSVSTHHQSDVSIPVCCSPTGLWNQTAKICMVHAPEVSRTDLTNLGYPQNNPYNLTDRYPKCQEQYYQLDPYSRSSDNFSITHEGGLYVQTYDDVVPSNQWCLLRLAPEDGDDRVSNLKFHAWICIPSPEVAMSSVGRTIEFIVYPVGLALSEMFFLLTFITYLLLPELRDVYGRCVMSIVGCFFIAYLCLIIMKTSTGVLGLPGCNFLAFLTYASFMGAFFWFNIISFHMFATVRSGFTPRGNPWNYYAAYAWGATAICTTILIIVEFSNSENHPLKPGFAVLHCWFSNDVALTAYFYGPIGFIWAVNTGFFIYCAVTLIKLKQADPEGSAKINFKLYLRMGLIMGNTWILEIVTWQITKAYPDSDWHPFVVLFLDFVNILLGLLIFVVIVCRKVVWHLFRAKYLSVKTNPPFEEEMNDTII